jgi:hypothetical protein
MVVFDRNLKADALDAFISKFATHLAQNVPADAAALPCGVHGEPVDAAAVLVAGDSDRADWMRFSRSRSPRPATACGWPTSAAPSPTVRAFVRGQQSTARGSSDHRGPARLRTPLG